jgi:hypothetical protein
MFRSGFPVVGLLLLGFLWAQAAVAEGQDKAGVTPVQPPAAAPASQSLNARTLGIGEALFDYCAQNDPEGAAKVRARLKQLAQGMSKEALAEARRSAEYRSAHDSGADFLSKVDPRNAHRVCSERAVLSK